MSTGAATIAQGATYIGQTAYGNLNEGIYYVQGAPYNAIGNGTVDDTVAIQTAINAAGVAGGTVDFGVGTYKVTASITQSFANVKLRGAGKAICSIFTTDPAVTPLKVGTLSTSTKINYPEIEGITIQAATTATLTSGAGSTPVYALQVFGVSQCQINDVIALNGGAVFHHQNSDLFNFRQFQMSCSTNSTYASRWYQGAVDDVTIGSLVSCYFKTVANNQIALCLTEEVTGTANEFNRLNFTACKFGGTTGLTGNYGVQFIAGLRGSSFVDCAFQYNTAGQFDFSGFDPGAGSYHIFMSVDECSLIGTSGNLVVDTFHSIGNSNISIAINNPSVQSTTNVFTLTANNPNIFLTGSDFSVTNVINCSGGSPRINIGGIAKWTVSGARITGAGTPVIKQLNGVSGSLITASVGSGTVTATQTSTAITFGTALDVTPVASDVTVQFTSNPGTSLGDTWITSISSTGFTLNSQIAPTNSPTFRYKCITS